MGHVCAWVNTRKEDYTMQADPEAIMGTEDRNLQVPNQVGAAGEQTPRVTFVGWLNEPKFFL